MSTAGRATSDLKNLVERHTRAAAAAHNLVALTLLQHRLGALAQEAWRRMAVIEYERKRHTLTQDGLVDDDFADAAELSYLKWKSPVLF